VRLLPAAVRVPVPWRNGGGITREIAATPQWRLSIADVDRDGPFSAYPEYHRVITPIRGNGMVLTVEGTLHRVLRHHPFTFPGAADTTCDLINGPVVNLNVMSRAPARVEVRRVNAETRIDATAVVVLEGELTVGPHHLGPLDALVLDGPTNAESHFSVRPGHAGHDSLLLSFTISRD
jgi:environmental stress-induced protein Ves